jgi:S-adenosylmethionine-diacylglycerol 3-amino-3-carboxypropyl transferase
MAIGDLYSRLMFNAVHMRNLVYNACWEDPRLDRVALDLGPDDSVLVITSAGCNALDYALCEPRQVHCVDMNPRQNALLELKQAGIRNLDFETFFAMFGRGRVLNAEAIYQQKLRPTLTPQSRFFWDDHIHFFSSSSPSNSLYFHGTSGFAARLINLYVDRVPGLRDSVDAILEAKTLDEQEDIYFNWIYEAFWNKPLRWMVGRDTALSLLGVPRAQREYLEQYYAGGISQFIEDCIESVFARLPLGDNYFWRVYLTGQYTKTCCPEYLKEENFHKLKDGLINRVTPHTNTVAGFLRGHNEPISRYILLDHMDWLSSHRLEALHEEWQCIIDQAAPEARAIWRSGGLKVEFVDPIEVTMAGGRHRMSDIITYQHDLAKELHQQDRVHTYGSFYIAHLATG